MITVFSSNKQLKIWKRNSFKILFKIRFLDSFTSKHHFHYRFKTRFHSNVGLFIGALQTVQDTQHPNTYRAMYKVLEVVPERNWFIFSINLGICFETTISVLLFQLLLILPLLNLKH